MNRDMRNINAAIAQAMELCPRPELLSWGRRWISGVDRSQATLARIAAAIGVVNVRPDPFARELQEAGRRALMPDELFDWITKGAVLAALEWTRAAPELGNCHESLASRIGRLAFSMGERWKARGRPIGGGLSPLV
jgi:broad specificity phosphatase PhoE